MTQKNSGRHRAWGQKAGGDGGETRPGQRSGNEDGSGVKGQRRRGLQEWCLPGRLDTWSTVSPTTSRGWGSRLSIRRETPGGPRMETALPVGWLSSDPFLMLAFAITTSLVAQRVKRPPAMGETRVRSPGREDPLEKETAPTPGLLPVKSDGQRSLVGCSPWGRKESDN